MPSKKRTYNLPGSGTLNCNVFEYTWKLFDFFEAYGHDHRIKNIYQLGHLIDVFPGAHHNRYEYLFLQWTIISELCKLKDSNLGLSCNRSWYGKIKSASKHPSCAEILQVLSLILNLGHLGGTFASERAFLEFLKADKTVRRTFKSGLEEPEKKYFEEILSGNKMYKIHHLIAFYFINRGKRKSSKNVDFCNQLLRGYCYNDGKDNFTKLRNWKLYRSIRRISYLILDSHYAPVPFSLDLSSILLNFDKLNQEIITEDSSYNVALNELEKVLERTVYLSSNSALTTSIYSQEYLKSLEKLTSKELEKHKITSLHRLLKDKFITLGRDEINLKKDWSDHSILQLNFEQTQDFDIEEFKDPFAQENYLSERIGKSYSNTSLLPNPRNNFFTLSFSVRNSFDNTRKIKTGLNIGTQSLRLIDNLPSDYQNSYREENFKNLTVYLLKSALGWDKKFLLENRKTPSKISPFIYCRGTGKFESQINEYIESVSKYIGDDEKHELIGIKETVLNINYNGFYFAYLGASKVFNTEPNQPTAEFDGLIFCPQNSSGNFSFIVESKNTQFAQTEAKRQLTERLDEELVKELKYELEDIDAGVYAKISFL